MRGRRSADRLVLPDGAHVSVLGVRPAWRGRGCRAGVTARRVPRVGTSAIAAVELGVDSENQTGATRLYERVGMRVIRHSERWQEEL
jgi:mycothiol synthase